MINCEDCANAKVGSGEIIYCKYGYWENRLLKNVKKIQREQCERFDNAGDEECENF